MSTQVMAGSARIMDFCKVTDLDILEHTYKNLAPQNQEEIESVNKVLASWENQQAIANLLFYPNLIAKNLRQEVIVKALEETDMPYIMLAAVVGLETLDTKSVARDWCDRVCNKLTAIMQSHADVISSRASITVWEFVNDTNYRELLDIYPVDDGTANKNILAYLMMRFSDSNKKVLKKDLKSINIKWLKRRKFVKKFKKFKRKQRHGNAVFMQAPLYQEVPNFEDVDQSLSFAISE